MKPRIYFLLILAFVSLNLFAQPKIVSIAYDGDEATLTRNTPPTGIIYYWQGTSCGELTDNSESTYIATTSSTYYLRGFDSTAGTWNASCATTIVFFADVTAPILSDVTGGPVDVGDNISATSNENGMIYLVPDGTAQNLGDITSAKVAEASATKFVAVSLSTAGLGAGDFIVYAVDGSDNISASSNVISVVDVTAPILSGVTGGPVEPGDNISATSNENGMIYLVPDGTAPNLGSIDGAKIASATASAGVAVNLSTAAAVLGDYIVYAVDASDNISAASAAISIVDLTAPVLSDVTAGPVNVGDDILATSNEDGQLYLVPDGTAANLGDIESAKVAEVAAVANVAAALWTLDLALGNYIVYAVDGSDNVSAASAAISVEDLTAPVLSDVSEGPVNVGDDILATSNEDGQLCLVPDGTAPNLGDIASAKVDEAASTAGVPGTLSTTGLDLGNYIVYAIDASDNISAASAVILVNDQTGIDFNKISSADVQLYPVNVKDILHIKSKIQVSSVIVYSLKGTQLININTPTESIDMSSLNEGIYVVRIKLVNNTIFTGKVSKK